MRFIGALPDPLSADTFLVLASKNRQNASLFGGHQGLSLATRSALSDPYPPIPQEQGSVTFKAADVATAASAGGAQWSVVSDSRTNGFIVPAFPPLLRISSPAAVARGWDDDTTPFVPYTTDLLLGNSWNTGDGSSTLVQSIRAADAMVGIAGYIRLL